MAEKKPSPEVAHRLRRAPRSCPGPHPRPEKVARGYAPVVGENPIWAGFYARYHRALHAFTTSDAPRTRRGFRVKVLWAMAPENEAPVTISGENIGTRGPLRFAFEDMPETSDPTLTPDAGGVGEDGWREFPSYVYFDRAGCFTIEASSPRGSWRIGFGFGRQ